MKLLGTELRYFCGFFMGVCLKFQLGLGACLELALELASVVFTNIMAPTRYSASDLMEVGNKLGNVLLPLHVYQKLKHLKLLKNGVITMRGKRAGAHRVRPYDTISGVNTNNLISVRTLSESNYNRKMTIGCVNVRSIRNKSADFVDNILEDGYDLCLITETWLRDVDSVQAVHATPSGFCFDHCPRIDRSGGGVGIVHVSSMKCKQKSAGTRKSFEYSEWILKSISDILYVIVVYRPPYSELHPVTVSEFIEEFGEYLESVITTPHKLIIGGDFNIHVEDAGNGDAKRFCDLLECMNLKNHVWIPTHMSGHALDLLITRDDDSILIRDTERKRFISDHAFVKVSTVLTKPKADVKVISYRKIKDLDLHKFKDDIRSSGLMDMSDKSIHEKAVLYDSVLKETLDIHAPMVHKEIKVKQASPWYNQELREFKRKKRRAEDAWIKSGTEEDAKIFKLFRSEYIRLCDAAKMSFYTNQVLKCEGDQKKLYKLILKLTEGEKVTSYPECNNNYELCETFNEFFLEKIDNIMNDIEHNIQSERIVNVIDYKANQDTSCAELVTFEPLSTEEVGKLVARSATKTCSLDPIPTSLLKQCLDVLLEPITNIVNSSLHEGEFPQNWKCAVVSPLLKKAGMDMVYKNYRPVSNLSFVSKIVEKAGLLQYVDHLESIDKFSAQNSAYKKYHSTETLLVKIHSDIMNNMDCQRITMLVLLDLSAAFDTVSLDILSEIFQYRFNIKGNVLKWFQTYLTDREQRIMINSAMSDVQKLRYGVPQGSCAGPVTFLGYLSSMYDVIENHLPMVGGYADDHQLYLAFKPGSADTEQEAVSCMQECIADVRAWMLTHKLKINDSKTEFLLLGTKQQLEKISISEIMVGDSLIRPVDKIRNLGVIFDSQMSMLDHVNQICKKGFHQLTKIRQIKKYLDRPAVEAIVHSFVTSNMDYCNALLYGCPLYVTNKLQKMQNCAARVICGARKFDPVTPLMKELHWLPVTSRIIYKIALLVFKCIHGQAPRYLCDLIQRYEPGRTLRSGTKNLLRIPRTNTRTLGRRAFTYAAPSVWNDLPEHIKCHDDVDSFKTLLKTYLFSSVYAKN